MTLWPELLKVLNNGLQNQLLDQAYLLMKHKMPNKLGKQRNWYTDKRKAGVISVSFAEAYGVPGTYARLQGLSAELYELARDVSPGFKITACSTLKNVDHNFRRVVLNLLNHALIEFGLTIIELDFESCHCKVLASLFPDKTPLLREIFDTGTSMWNSIAKCLGETPNVMYVL